MERPGACVKWREADPSATRDCRRAGVRKQELRWQVVNSAQEKLARMVKRVVVAIAGGLAGGLVGLLTAHLTGWRWWVRICVAIGPAIALLIAERKRILRTAEEVNRPVSIIGGEPPDLSRNPANREDGNLPLR